MLLLAGLLVLLLQDASRRYSEELLQRLNANVAMYVTAELALVDGNGVNRAALQELSRRVMTVNPSAEVYLLAADGRILDTLVERKALAVDRVATQPIDAFLARDRGATVRGDDPLRPGSRRVFSAARLAPGGGYLYVVLGGRRDEAVGTELWASHALQVGAATALLLALAAAVVAGGSFRYLTRRLRRLDERLRGWIESQPSTSAIASIRAPGADEIGVLEARVDAMCDTIDRQLAELKATDDLRRELVANVSHDLRTPLSTLRAYLETILLKGSALDLEDRKQHVAVALRQTELLSDLVDALFELARLDSGMVRARLEPVALGDLLHDIAMRFRPLAQKAGLTVTAIAGDRVAVVAADVALIERALANLVDNAIRHTPVGGHVRLEAWPEADSVRVRVSDTGVGIDSALLPQIFDRHRSSDDPASSGFAAANGPIRSSHRAGLGLAIVKRIVELHGGQVRVVSQPSEGSTFEFALRRASCADSMSSAPDQEARRTPVAVSGSSAGARTMAS